MINANDHSLSRLKAFKVGKQWNENFAHTMIIAILRNFVSLQRRATLNGHVPNIMAVTLAILLSSITMEIY